MGRSYQKNMICFDCRRKQKGSAKRKVLPVYQLPPDSSNPDRRLWRGIWVLFVCRRCYGRHYEPWKVRAGV